jgi:hypothetical protein
MWSSGCRNTGAGREYDRERQREFLRSQMEISRRCAPPLKVDYTAIGEFDESALDLKIVCKRMIRAAEEVLPKEISNLCEMTPKEWNSMCNGLRTAGELADRLLLLFERDLPPESTGAILDIQNVASSIADQYVIWPDLLGVERDKLPRRNDGLSAFPDQQALYKLLTREVLKLLRLCAELLLTLDDLPNE